MSKLFRRENAQTVVHALTGLQRACERAAIDSTRLKDRQAAQAKADAYRQSLNLISHCLGVEYELYGDEIELAIYEAEQDGVKINY